MQRLSMYILSVCILLIVSSCKKYLEVTTDKKLVVITNLIDLQSLLDASSQINFVDPGAGEVSADNYYLTEDIWEGLDEYDRNQYIWKDYNVIPPFSVFQTNAWANCFNVIYRANTVLFNINTILKTPNNTADYDNIRGQAHFLRAKFNLELAWVWCLAYDHSSAETDLGIPLRLTPDFNEQSVRATLQQSYDQIITDLKIAVALLPETPLHTLRPSRAAAYGYLSRCYLSMRDYVNAGKYADSCLQLYPELMDFNVDIPDTNSFYPIPQFNKETVYFCRMASPRPVYYGNIDTSLYKSFGNGDWRRTLFFTDDGNNNIGFKGSYNKSRAPFTGLASDEMYLTRAECFARNGNPAKAIEDLNYLLEHRYRQGTFTPIPILSTQVAIDTILVERRKELIYRELRWMDIKRLNKEDWNIELKRVVHGKIYALSPNDLRYALAIPEDIIARSGMPQNPR
ncbi:RagB/SusD family nutrient uptake outer membrane protein [Agriterribacter sp.]|uniref:RagB/SusD family nutrient uptake outer membrane protein n=1 Tax=Agriterribacter sp. TaxID=2821509 RepID=UPI002BFDA9AD|nr:RagB/SusD family nutrient uptake outer membrane protein [Agriterribacter sp.]HTN08703.1 RagB/SusD family nutrient uptake outer membrane protein [Agriterribacter sp.]